MRSREKFLPVIVFVLVAAGFVLPELSARMADAGMEEEVVKIRDTHREIPLAGSQNLLEILETADALKQSVELRSGEYMAAETVEREAGDLLDLLMRYGVIESQWGNRWLLQPVFASGIKEQENARVFWDCVCYSEDQGPGSPKMEIFLDDETGYLMSFTAYPGMDGTKIDPAAAAEGMQEFLNAYYPSAGRTEFAYQEKEQGHEFVFTVKDEKEIEYEFRFLIMENGQVVFNM